MVDRKLAYGIALMLLAVALVGANLLGVDKAMAGELADQSSSVVAQAASVPARGLISAPVDAKAEPVPPAAKKPRKAERSVLAWRPADMGLILGVGF